MKSLRDYINLVEGQQLDELQSLDDLQAQQKAGTKPATPAPAGNSFDAKLAQANAAQKAKPAGTKPVQAAQPAKPDPKGPGPRPTGWMAGMRGDDARWDTANAAKYNPDGTLKQAAQPALAKSDPAVLKIQQDLIAKGAKIKADGIMGPATQAAQAQFAGKPAQGAQPAPATTPTTPATTPTTPATTPTTPEVNNGPWPAGSPQAAAYSKLSPEDQKWLGGADPTDQMILARAPNGGKPSAAQGAMPAPAATQDMGDGSKITTAPNGQVAATNDDGTPYIPGSNPNLPKNKAVAQAAMPAPVVGSDDGSQIATGPNGQVASTDSEGNPYVPGSNPNLPKNKAAAQPVAPNINDIVKSKLGENTSFQNDELTRIVSLVQYR